jgi:hypothetical protein
MLGDDRGARFVEEPRSAPAGAAGVPAARRSVRSATPRPRGAGNWQSEGWRRRC